MLLWPGDRLKEAQMNRRGDAEMHDRLRVRVLPAEKALIIAAARERGVSMSSFIRDVVTSAAQQVSA